MLYVLESFQESTLLSYLQPHFNDIKVLDAMEKTGATRVAENSEMKDFLNVRVTVS